MSEFNLMQTALEATEKAMRQEQKQPNPGGPDNVCPRCGRNLDTDEVCECQE